MHHITSQGRPGLYHLKRSICGTALVCTLLCVAACSGAPGNAAGLHDTQGSVSGIAATATPPANSAASAATAGDGGDDTPAKSQSVLVPVQTTTAMPTQSAAISSSVANTIGAVLLPANARQQADALILDMLINITTNGYNSATNGLWINWRYGTAPLQANLNGSGKPDSQPTRHDRLTDLRYLRALLSYKSLHAGDTQFDGEIAKYTAIVKGEFSGGDDRGWVYDEFAQLATLSSDPWFAAMLQKTANYYTTAMWHADTGMVYEIDAQHPNGYYRVDWAIEQACALMQAGTQFHRPEWTATGQRMMQFVRAHAYLSAYHIYPFMVDNVLGSGGANPDETFYSDTSSNKKTATNGSRVVLGETAQEIISLLHAYQATGDATLLHDATDMLDALSPTNNTLGLWDATHLGYFKQVTFSGVSVQNPGTLLLDNTKKEAGRQGQMLEAVALANKVTDNRYETMEAALFAVVSGPAYYRAGHGVLYEVRPDWSLVANKGSATGYQDWVTTEAMGIAIEGLFAVMQ